MIELADETFVGTFPFRPRYLDVGDAAMHYVDEGEGDPLLFVHGVPTWGYLWRAFVGPLSARNRCLVCDHIGMGKSGARRTHKPYRLAERISDLERFVLALDLRGLTLVVHDWGGPVGLGVAVRHPDRIARLVLTNTWAHARWPGAPLPRLVEMIRSDRGERFVLDRNGWVEAAIIGGTMHPPKRPAEPSIAAYLAPYPTPDSRWPLLCWSRDIPLNEHDPSFGELAAIEAELSVFCDRPVLLVWGMRDPVLPPTVLTLWRAVYPDAEVVEISDASHFVQEDAPEQVIARLERFLAS